MKVKFWLGTYGVDPAAIATRSTAEPMLSTDVSAVAIEVIEYEDSNNVAVLLSTLKDANSPEQLECRIGFANGAKASNDWRDRGFPLVDAIIGWDGNKLRVKSPCFVVDNKEMQYETDILTLTGVRFNEGGKTSKTFTTRYDQSQDAPDYLSPATQIMRRRVRWELQRSNVKRAGGIKFELGPDMTTRCPRLAPLEQVQLKLKSVWTGVSDIPDMHLSDEDVSFRRLSRADTFGVPAFRFDNVDIIGFRIDLDALVNNYKDKLARLIEPLNFHLKSAPAWAPDSGRNSITDFRYVPATGTVIIELLRYGKMRLQRPDLPLQVEDFQSQHELLVRVLVGRIDDDTVQAHDPAVFVPAIFVDNPWSKILGREVQGFDKHMADFCVFQNGKPTRLQPNGRVSGTADTRALVDIKRIDLVKTFGSQAAGATIPILDLSYPPGIEMSSEAFENIDLELALGGSSLSLTRWRQSDFTDPEFRRSFARSAVRRTLKGFRSIQVSPVGERAMDKTWITGTFAVDDTVRFARPAGVVNLTLHDEPTAPEGWRLLCDLVGVPNGGQKSLSFPTGNWYRMQCSMDLTIDNGLE
jgi:hypothetical protein